MTSAVYKRKNSTIVMLTVTGKKQVTDKSGPLLDIALFDSNLNSSTITESRSKLINITQLY